MSTPLLVWDPGSFRDPEGSVFFYNDDVYRTLHTTDIAKVQTLIATDFCKKYVAEGTIIKSEIRKNPLTKTAYLSPYILQHEKIPFITYPYEWSFYMLKDAALLTLSILKDALKNDFILKDGTAWNVSFHKGKMCFFDILSIDKYREGQVWEGYSQFCKEFLYPLLINAHKGINFHSFFKGSLTGIDPKVANAFFSIWDWRLSGVFKHVFLNAKLTYQKNIDASQVKGKFSLPKESLIGIARNLTKIIENLHPSHKDSVWQTYTTQNTYTNKDVLIKREFIADAVEYFKGQGSLVDLGSNTGDYSRLAAKKMPVISCDIDSACIDRIYLNSRNSENLITPVVLDLMNPSPQCGWRLQERSQIFQRLKPNSFIALALIHHICIASNVPLENFVEFLASIAQQGVLEWVDKRDPMVQFLLRNREDIFPNYTWSRFEKLVTQYFKIERIKELNNGTRKLCLLMALS